MAKKKKKSPKKRQAKGLRLSEVLQRKEEALADQDALDAPSAGDDELVDAGASSTETDDEVDYESSASSYADDDEDYADEAEVDEPSADDEADDDEEASPASTDDEDWDDDEEDWDDEDEVGAAQLGNRRYMIAGFFGAWLIAAYIAGKALEMAWSEFAGTDWFVRNLPSLAAVPYEGELISRASISLVLGGIVAAGMILRYYYKPSVRQWAEEVTEELSHVKWPNRKEVGNNTVVVMVASAVITLYLSLLDRLWGFVTNLVYSVGA